MKNSLAIVMPVYNEEESIFHVVKEWHMLTEIINDSRLVVLNDGSKDTTLKILLELKEKYKKLVVINKENSGHGQTCLEGYKYAIKGDYTYVFQTDSDGQTDPQEFLNIWQNKENANFIFGYRKNRAEGLPRILISLVLKVILLFLTGKCIKDANVPFRLMKCKDLEQIVSKIPRDFYLVNILLTVLILKSGNTISWKPITFKNRIGGISSINFSGFAQKGLELIKQIKPFLN